jgi:hypothetical protein
MRTYRCSSVRPNGGMGSFVFQTLSSAELVYGSYHLFCNEKAFLIGCVVEEVEFDFNKMDESMPVYLAPLPNISVLIDDIGNRRAEASRKIARAQAMRAAQDLLAAAGLELSAFQITEQKGA